MSSIPFGDNGKSYAVKRAVLGTMSICEHVDAYTRQYDGQAMPARDYEWQVLYKSDLPLKEGYALVCYADDRQFCGDGGRTRWALIDPSDMVIAVFESCNCGRGCGGGDCVRDDWGRHDCAPEIEAVRVD